MCVCACVCVCVVKAFPRSSWFFSISATSRVRNAAVLVDRGERVVCASTTEFVRGFASLCVALSVSLCVCAHFSRCMCVNWRTVTFHGR